MRTIPKPVVLLVFATACTLYREPLPRPRAAGARDKYEQQLLRSDVRNSDAYAEWSAAGKRALRDQLTVRPSFREQLFFPPAHATAVGYRLELRRGQKVTLELERQTGARIFAELFEEIGPGQPVYRLVQSAGPDANAIAFEASTDGPHVLRIQPEMLKGGSVAVTLTSAAALTFPVHGKTARAIGSRFGEARAGGARSHEGIDIFAPRDTRVLAVAGGIVTSVANTPVGGKVVWQEDPERNVTYYYAHLNSHSVRVGDRVQAGDEIGKVGNTGNASASSPHLHFALYQPGRVAINPEPFLFDQPADAVAPLLVDARALGDVRAARHNGIALRNEPQAAARAVGTLRSDEDLYVIGALRDWYRVRTMDGRSGFVRGSELGPALASKGAQ
jgi:murein DD-endopeptidase MepM/ murein hydrolase activator NlpD